MEIITRKRTVWLTFLDVLYKKKLPLQNIHAKGVPFFVTRCDSNARPSEPESDALFTKLRGHFLNAMTKV